MKGFIDELIKKANSLEDLCNLVKDAEKTEADSGLVWFGDLEDWQCFKEVEGGQYSDEAEPIAICMKTPEFAGFNAVDISEDFAGDQYTYEDHVLVRPIEVEIREKVPSEVVIMLEPGKACKGIYCSQCFLNENVDVPCRRDDYTWTLTATPKKG